MDHSDKKKQNLEVLGLENVNVLCLPELWDAIKEKLPSDVSKMRILNIYVMWLHEQLATFDISAEDAVRDCISTWYEFLKATNYDSRIIAEALDDWQRDEAQHDPTSWRRLGIIAAELRAVMISFVPPSKKSPGTSPDGHYGHMHPDRIMLSRESPSASGLGDGKHEVIVIDPDADLPPKNGGTPRGVGSNLPFLTGSNRLVLGDIADSLPHREEEKVSQVAAAEPRTTSITPNSKDPQSDISKTSGKSSSGYVCFRCGVPGHSLQNCPTNLDPKYDRIPPKDYICNICGKVADHYLKLCPRNKDPGSVTQQRRRAIESRGLGRGPSAPECGRSFQARGSSRLRDRAWDLIDSRARGRSRSRSPDHQTSLGHRGGHFVREHDFTDRETARYRDRRPMGRSSSPLIYDDVDETAPEKASPVTDSARRKKRPRKRVTFSNDLVTVMKGKEEGRLSYYDIYDEEVPTASLARQTRQPSTGVDISSRKQRNPKRYRKINMAAQDFQDALIEMIAAESAKTDLLVLVSGVERISDCGVVNDLLSGKQELCINQKVKIRPCGSDFFESAQEQKPEVEQGTEEVADLPSAAAKQGHPNISADEWAAGSSHEHVAHVGVEEADTKEQDAMIVDTEPAALTGSSTAEVKLMTIATGTLKIDGPGVDEAKTGASEGKAIEVGPSDGSQTEDVVMEPAQTVEEDDPPKDTEHFSIGIEYSACGGLGSQAKEQNEPVEGRDMEVVMCATVDQIPLPSKDDESGPKPLVEDGGVDSEMAEVEISEHDESQDLPGKTSQQISGPVSSPAFEGQDDPSTGASQEMLA